MRKRIFILIIILFTRIANSFTQPTKYPLQSDSIAYAQQYIKLQKKFYACSEFIDATISSISSLNSLIKKENYRNKISSFNNPTNSDLGFNLELEVQAALKPILAKTKKLNKNKFTDVVSSIIHSPATSVLTSLTGTGTVFNSLVSLVSNITTQEKNVSKQDLDSFMYVTSKYFGQYEKLNKSNLLFDQKIEKVENKLFELQLDIRDYLIDMIIALDASQQRSYLKAKPLEELLLKYFDKSIIDSKLSQLATNKNIYFPTDAIKTGKDISSQIQKIFFEYQKIYADNYQEIKTTLSESKNLGKEIDIKQVDTSLKDLENLFIESKNADTINLRINTLLERLKKLISLESLE